jgi:RES domain-containing protein
LLLASFKVIVTVEFATPSAVTGPEPVMLEFAATGDADINTTDPSALATGVTIERIFVSALLEANVQVETPEAFETEQAA